MRRIITAVLMAAFVAALAATIVMIARPAHAAPTFAATSTDASSTVTTGGTFQTIAAASAIGARGGCTVQNPTTATEVLYVNFGPLASATLNNSFSLSPGGSISCTIGNGVLNDAVNVTAPTTAHVFVAKFQ